MSLESRAWAVFRTQPSLPDLDTAENLWIVDYLPIIVHLAPEHDFLKVYKCKNNEGSLPSEQMKRSSRVSWVYINFIQKYSVEPS